MLGVLLTGCTNSQPNSIPTSIPYQPINSTSTAIATNTSISTFATTQTITPQEIKISSDDNYTLLEGFSEHVSSLAWSGDGKTLFIASPGQKHLVLFDIQSKKTATTLVSDSVITYIKLSPNKKTLAAITSTMDYITVRFMNLETGKIINTISVELLPIYDGATRLAYYGTGTFAPDGKKFVLSSGKQITLWDIESGSQIKELFRCETDFFINRLFVNSAKNMVVALYTKDWFKEKIFVGWDANTWELTKTVKSNELADYPRFAFSPDGNRFATTDVGKEIDIWDFYTFTKLSSITSSQTSGFLQTLGVAYDSSGKYIAVGDRSGVITIYNASTGDIVRQLVGGFDTAVLEFSPDGTRLAAGGGNERPGVVKIWDLSQP
jgi:WD40 repeat protein